MLDVKSLKMQVPDRIRVTDTATSQGVAQILPLFEAGLYLPGMLDHHGLAQTYSAKVAPIQCEIEITHAGLGIVWCPSATQTIRIRGKELTSSQDRALIFNSHEPHTEIYRNRNDSYRAVVLSEKLIDGLMPGSLSTENLHFVDVAHSLTPRLRETVNALVLLQEALPAGFEASDCLASSLAACLLTEFPHNQMSRISQLGSGTSVRQSVIRIKSLMSEMFREKKLNLNELARLCHMSKFELIRKFREGTGETPAKYLAKLRMGMAIAEIRGSDKSISEIALDLGYDDFSAFSRAFLRLTGRQPSSYRG